MPTATRWPRSHGAGEKLAVAWDGLVDGTPLPDGTYRATVTARDPWGNAPTTAAISLVIDTVEPPSSAVGAQSADPVAVFTPNGDGTSDTVAGRLRGLRGGRPGGRRAGRRRRDRRHVRARPWPAGAGSTPGTAAPPAARSSPTGPTRSRCGPWTGPATGAPPLETAVVAYGALGFVKSSVVAFHARDNDRLARTHDASASGCASPATVTWRLLGPGRRRRRHPVRGARDGRRHRTAGRGTGGSRTARGRRRASTRRGSRPPTARRAVAQAVKVTVDAFRLASRTTTPSRGQLLTATVVSTEPLRANPRIVVTQPGRPPVIVFTTRIVHERVPRHVPPVGGRPAGHADASTVRVRHRTAATTGAAFDYPIH